MVEFDNETELAACKAHDLYQESIRQVRPLRELRFAADCSLPADARVASQQQKASLLGASSPLEGLTWQSVLLGGSQKSDCSRRDRGHDQSAFQSTPVVGD
jgi:hypothetical protein